jgi:hypothetical protein
MNHFNSCDILCNIKLFIMIYYRHLYFSYRKQSCCLSSVSLFWIKGFVFIMKVFFLCIRAMLFEILTIMVVIWNIFSVVWWSFYHLVIHVLIIQCWPQEIVVKILIYFIVLFLITWYGLIYYNVFTNSTVCH